MVTGGAHSNGHESHSHPGGFSNFTDADSVRRAAHELKLLTRSVVDRLEPLVAQVAETQQNGPYQRTGCAWCPVCALIALSRGENHELLGYIASHGASLLSFVRALLESSDDESEDLLMSAFAEMAEYARGFAERTDSSATKENAEQGQPDGQNTDNVDAQKRRNGFPRDESGTPRRGRFEHIPVLIG